LQKETFHQSPFKHSENIVYRGNLTDSKESFSIVKGWVSKINNTCQMPKAEIKETKEGPQLT